MHAPGLLPVQIRVASLEECLATLRISSSHGKAIDLVGQALFTSVTSGLEWRISDQPVRTSLSMLLGRCYQGITGTELERQGRPSKYPVDLARRTGRGLSKRSVYPRKLQMCFLLCTDQISPCKLLTSVLVLRLVP